MKKILSAILSYLGMFMLGAYAASQFKFNTPIEDYRWVITSFFFGFFAILTFNTEEK
jgi:hypothetical protein